MHRLFPAVFYGILSGKGRDAMNAYVTGAAIKQLREQRNLTQAELAYKLGISASALSNYENGTRVPRDEIKVKIAEFFGVSVLDVFFAPKFHRT